jgi:steroid 5-alpha reductase family enzyme
MVEPLLTTAAWGLAGMLALMVATFVFCRSIANFGAVDAVWSFQFTPLVAWYALALDGDASRRIALVVFVGFWSVRLGLHLALRIARAHPVEDRRYAALRAEWGGRTNRRMLGFFLLQAVVSLPLSLPILLIAADRSPFPGGWDLAGFVLVIAALLGEAVADRQLQSFKARHVGSRAICREGLWSCSRHPNYFFEWLVWVGLAVACLGASYGWLGLAAPATMLFLLLRLTGIPAVEAAAIESRGDEYRAYQRETSAFFPMPPRLRRNRQLPADS